MSRVSRQPCEEGPLLDDQETEGQRQLHSLLLQQLHTQADVERCVAKKQCFAPATLYRPFGEQAAGVRSLSQFQALQDGEQELVSLRELGLTDAEIQLWLKRETSEQDEKPHGVHAAPGVKQQRLQVIRDKIAARAELLSRPQRFATSQPLSRREMEIEQALFQGKDRLGFLTALYHRDGDHQSGQQGDPPPDPVGCLYRDVLTKDRQNSPEASQEETSRTESVQSGDSRSSEETFIYQPEPQEQNETASLSSESQSDVVQAGYDRPPPPVPRQLNINQPIRSLHGAVRAGSDGPLTITGAIETILDEEILKNRESDEGIRSIPRFQKYQPGKPSKVLCVKNLSRQASVAQLVALFSRFERENRPPVLYRLLTGRMRGQAFITLPDVETAQNALQMVHGYRGLGKPLVVEFGHERQEEEKQKTNLLPRFPPDTNCK
uniref:RNA binding motif protein 41 n=1 Tax=Takifugu rubripes TaxID=31033 RepID=A0A674PGZ7_TAKRU